MIKLLMTWDIRPGHETSYLDFVSQNFSPGLMRLGLEPTEVWYTYWGEGPQILMGFVGEDLETVRAVLKNPEWLTFRKELQEHVLNFEYKLLNATGRFQM
jgi:hypothetical protein